MAETFQFALPLLEGGQAQKHVTVNEAIVRLDAAAQLRLVSVSETVPPTGLADGVAYGVPIGAVNDWDGQQGKVAVVSNGGWVFIAAKDGWRAWVEDAHDWMVFFGTAWQANAVTLTPSGSGVVFRTIEFDHVLQNANTSIPTQEFPAGHFVLGVTTRVLTTISGTSISGWRCGVPTQIGRYGNLLELTAGSTTIQPGGPHYYSTDTPIWITGNGGGDFSTGIIRLAIHTYSLTLPGSA